MQHIGLLFISISFPIRNLVHIFGDRKLRFAVFFFIIINKRSDDDEWPAAEILISYAFSWFYRDRH